jgi:DNA-binding SARP family transcriptional activator
LHVRLFGIMDAWNSAGLSALPKMRKTRAVLAVLALRSPEPVARGHLTALLWSRRDPQQARASLRQSVHELQEAIGADPGRCCKPIGPICACAPTLVC